MRLNKKQLLAMGASLTMAFATTSANALGFLGADKVLSPDLGAVTTIVPVTNTVPDTSSLGLDSVTNVIPSNTLPTESVTQVLSLGDIGSSLPLDPQTVLDTATLIPEITPTTLIPEIAPTALLPQDGITLPSLDLSAVTDTVGALPIPPEVLGPVTLELTEVSVLKGGQLLTVDASLGLSLLGLSLNLDLNIGDTQPIPEPSTYAMMGVGLLGLAFARRRKQMQ